MYLFIKTHCSNAKRIGINLVLQFISVLHKTLRLIATNATLFKWAVFTLPTVVIVGAVIIPVGTFAISHCILKTRSTGNNNIVNQNKGAGHAGHRHADRAGIDNKVFSQMCSDDSLGIIIDIRDSVIMLVCKGVLLRPCRIQAYRLSKMLLRRLAEPQGQTFCDTVFEKKYEIATIAKMPVTVKNAPKDSSASSKCPVIDSAAFSAGYVSAFMEFDRGVNLHIHQNADLSFLNRISSMPRNIAVTVWFNLRTLWESLSGGSLTYSIGITVSRDDAIILFRALPLSAHMMLYRPL